MINEKVRKKLEQIIKEDKNLQEILDIGEQGGISKEQEEFADILLSISNIVKKEGTIMDTIKFEKYKEDLIVKGFGKIMLDIIKNQVYLLDKLANLIREGEIEFKEDGILKIVKEIIQIQIKEGEIEVNGDEEKIKEREEKLFGLLCFLIYAGLKAFSINSLLETISFIIKEYTQKFDAQTLKEKQYLIFAKIKIKDKLTSLLKIGELTPNHTIIMKNLFDLLESIEMKLNKMDTMEKKTFEEERKDTFIMISQNLGKYLPPAKQEKFFDLLKEAIEIYYEKMKEI